METRVVDGCESNIVRVGCGQRVTSRDFNGASGRHGPREDRYINLGLALIKT